MFENSKVAKEKAAKLQSIMAEALLNDESPREYIYLKNKELSIKIIDDVIMGTVDEPDIDFWNAVKKEIKK
jgi:hypothetical protein